MSENGDMQQKNFDGKSEPRGAEGISFKARVGANEINCFISRKAVVRLANDSTLALQTAFSDHWWRIEGIATKLLREGRAASGRLEISETDVQSSLPGFE